MADDVADDNPWRRAVWRTRRAIIGIQGDAERELAAGYRQTRARLDAHLADFLDRYRQARDAAAAAEAQARSQATDTEAMPSAEPPVVPLRWLYDVQGGNLPQMEAAIAMELGAYGRVAHGITTQAKQQSVDAGSQGAQAAMTAAIRPIARWLPSGGRGFFRPANDAAVRAFVERARNGGRLAVLFDSFGRDASQALRDTIASGLAAGVNPRSLGRELSRTIDNIGYSRAVTICRTEMVHAWHGAALANYRANSDVVTGWMWMAEKSAFTCAACLALDGSIHDLEEDLDDHPNGRCAKGPVTKGYDEILAAAGIDASGLDLGPEPWTTYQPGSDWLANQDAATQREVFGGRAAANAYAAGAAPLAQFAATRADPAWGISIYQQSLRGMGLDASDYADAG